MNNMTDTIFTYRFLARFVIEAETPIAVGTGGKNIVTDAVVATDINGLPYIPGTAIAGVIRHLLEEAGVDTDEHFGYQEKDKGNGSRIIFTDALMVGKEGKVIDGLHTIDFSDPFYAHFKEMPIRQHVRIGEKGTAQGSGKFDEQVAYKGTRFVFEMEYFAKDAQQEEDFDCIVQQLYDAGLRLGGGTRNGFGHIRVVEAMKASLDLTDEKGLKAYLDKSSSLADAWNAFKPIAEKHTPNSHWTHYTVALQPSDFFLFGSGFGDAEADMTPVTEAIIRWNGCKPEFAEVNYLIPGTSVKGALAHRTAYHYNKIRGWFADKGQGKTAADNEAVAALFGSSAGGDEDEGTIGNVLIDDVFIPSVDTEEENKLFNHITIDRFTGGVKGGALFTEKTTYIQRLTITLHISVRSSALKIDEDIKQAWDNALDDLKKGLLPLGGGTNRGNGTFTADIKS